MNVKTFTIGIDSEKRVTFHDVTTKIEEFLAQVGVRNGVAVVSSPHTTCSVLIQEESHDRNADGTEFLMQDLLNALETLVPTYHGEGQYLHPGPEHIDVATHERDEQARWSLNVDAHLRSVILGRSESIPIVDEKLQLGQFGRVYFADFDQIRARHRTVRVVIMGE